ncbi:MAG: dockerin type I repeat-containing protein, partial [candidate division Zixibacteria bacterium]|nr:dockerin type I repeat-containing protein [candidate division Zixibacteria bacterium]
LDYDASYGPFVLQGVMMPGWTYILETFDWGEGQTGTLTISREEMQAYNDECVDAEDLGVGDGYHFIHNVNATLSDDFDFTFCDNAQVPYSMTCGDVWYTWEADTDGYVNFDMCLYGESWDSKMFVYRGYSCNGDETIDPKGCSDDGCGYFGDGGFIELECTAGEVFMIRVAGWISGENEEDASCAAEGGMGTGYMDIYQHATSWRPVNDDCPDAIVGVIPAGGGVYTSPVNNLDMSSWGSCPDLYNNPDGSIGIAGAFCWMVFDAVSVSECTDMTIDFCGMDENAPPAQWSSWPTGVNLFTGCPCEGPFVTIPVTGGYWINDCEVLDPLYPVGFRWSRVWEFPGLLPGTYYFASSNWTMGVNSVGGSYTNPYDYNVNFRATTVECLYCEATSNINSCPPVAGASWIDGVNFEAIATSGTGCNAYEDHTDLVASLYKGISYELSVLMGKVGTAGVHDSCNAWIDWNQNSGFAPFVSELNEKINPTRLALTWTATVTVPLDAMEPGEGATGTTLMRVRMASDADGTNVPCGEKVWGEVEDFMVEVTSIECGDFDIDGMVDADDIAFLRDWYFGGTTAPDYWQRADIDGDGMITLADVIALVDAAYHGGDLICL